MTDAFNLCLECFYDTDCSFQCDSCGDHETIQGGLFHNSSSKKCGECSEAAIRLSRCDEINELKRQIASHKTQIAELKDKKVQLEVYEQRQETLKCEIDEALLNRGHPKLSDDDTKQLLYHEQVEKLLQLHIGENVFNLSLIHI